MALDDAVLVSRCLAGDTDAFGSLVHRYQASVYATAFYYVGRYGTAEDVSQEAFWEAYRSLRRLNDPARFGAWMKEITCRTSANWLRRHGKRLRAETPLPHRRTVSIEDAKRGPEGVAESSEQFERVQLAIDSLPEHYRLPIVLRYLQELSYDEIADFTGQTRDEVRGVLQRAGRQLREVLCDSDDNEDGIVKWQDAGK